MISLSPADLFSEKLDNKQTVSTADMTDELNSIYFKCYRLGSNFDSLLDVIFVISNVI